MIFDLQKSQSAPDCQLQKTGTLETFKILVNATKELSPTDLFELEEDLRFYGETGLIGIQMSRLLEAINRREPSEAA